MIKCKTCKKAINEESVIYYNGKDLCFCADCFTSFLCAEKEQDARNFLYKTICRIFGIAKMTGKLYAEVKRTMEQENLTYKNLTNVLHYMYDIKNVPVYSPTLFYVPQYTKEAREYFLTLKSREFHAVEAIKKQSKVNAKVVKPNYNYASQRKTNLKINPEEV